MYGKLSLQGSQWQLPLAPQRKAGESSTAIWDPPITRGAQNPEFSELSGPHPSGDRDLSFQRRSQIWQARICQMTSLL